MAQDLIKLIADMDLARELDAEMVRMWLRGEIDEPKGGWSPLSQPDRGEYE